MLSIFKLRYLARVNVARLINLLSCSWVAALGNVHTTDDDDDVFIRNLKRGLIKNVRRNMTNLAISSLWKAFAECS